MTLEILNHTKDRIPQKFIKTWVQDVYQHLSHHKILKRRSGLSIVFVSQTKIKKLNSQYRGKNKATDVLSFESGDPESLGELVLCLPVLKKQSKEHHLSLNLEIGYMILHGILHLLGYDHEQDAKEAQKMFHLQDKIFEKLC